jgi:hypothetical protein
MLRIVTKCEEMLQNVKKCNNSTNVLLLRNVTKCEEMLQLRMSRNNNMKASRVSSNMKAGRVSSNTFPVRFQFFQTIHFLSGSNFLTTCLPSGLE